jgi:hypothetical protein
LYILLISTIWKFLTGMISEVEIMKLFVATAFAAMVFVGGNSPGLAQRDPNPQNDPDVRRGYNDTKERILQDRNGAENFRVHPSGESGALGTPPSEIRRDYEKEDRAKAKK